MQQPTFFVSNIDANESVIDANECVTSFLKHAQVNRILDNGTLDLFIGVTQHQNVFLSQYQNVTCFSNKPKKHPYSSICHAEFGKPTKFCKNPLQTHKNM